MALKNFLKNTGGKEKKHGTYISGKVTGPTQQAVPALLVVNVLAILLSFTAQPFQ